MPTFDYKCPKCGDEAHNVRVQRHDWKVECNECKTVMNKMISAPNLGGMDKYGRSK